MIINLLKTRRARHLVYLLCTLMLLGGQPLMALQENVRFVAREDRPDWLEPWLEAETYRSAWTSTSRWAQTPMGALQDHLVRWWDGTWESSWDLMDAALVRPTGPRLAAAGAPAAPGQVPIFTAVALGQVEESEKDAETFSEDELKELAETDALGSKKRITKATPLPNAPGLKVGASDFRPPKELIQLMAGKADLERTPLIPGWNLLSIPEEPADTDPAAVLAPIAGAYTRAYARDNCDTADPWKVYDPNDPAASDLTVLDPTKGFWLEATSAVDLPSDGTLPATTTIQICPGWNLIGYPAAQPRHVTNALHTIEGKYLRVFSFEATDADDPWEVYGLGVPEWANDMSVMVPGRGYWVLATEAATLVIANEGPDPIVEITSPDDLSVVTDFTDIVGTIESPILDNWRLTYQLIGEGVPVEIASGVAPVAAGGVLGTFDPTLLINGLYELKLEATDLDGRVVEDSIAVSVEGNMKIGHFTLSFVDLAIPLSGLDIEIVRTYDSRQKDVQGDFGYGWSLDIRQGSYQNNRPPGDGWQIVNPGGPFGLPCTSTIESKSHLTTVRLSDQEIYRFRLNLTDTAAVIGGCQARAVFEWVDGPLPGTTLEILGNDMVIYENESDRLLDQDSFQIFEPGDVKLTTRDGRIFHLDLATGVTHLEDLNGNAVDITVDGITHSSGVGIDFVRDAEGRIQDIVDLRGNSNLYSYDLAGDLVQHTDRASGETRFAYREHYLEDIHNALGVRAVRTVYDEDGRMVKVIDALGHEMLFARRLGDRREVVTNRLGFARIFEYDGRGNIIRETDELSNVTKRSYDGKDRLLMETDPLGNSNTLAYDAAGDLVSAKDALGNITSFTYEGSGNPLTVHDALGRVTVHEYDGNGNGIRTLEPTGNETRFSYDAAGNILTETDALGNIVAFSYDGRGNRTRQVDAAGTETIYTYDTAGNRLTETTARSTASGVEALTIRHVYDDLDRVIRSVLPNATELQFAYNLVGQVLESTDPMGRITRFRYNERGNQISATYADGTATIQTYDNEGQVTASTDRAGRGTNFEYDAAGRLVRTTHPDGAVDVSTYDATGRLVASTEPRGNPTTYEWDAVGRRTRVVDALGNATTSAYDAVGQQVSITDPRGEITRFEYDDGGRLVRTVFSDGSFLQKEYDLLGRRVAQEDQARVRTELTYDALGRLATVTDALGGITRFSYDEQGNRIEQADANGRTTRFRYDGVGRQTSRILPDGATESILYDVVGNPISRTDFMGRTVTMAYDASDRLIAKSYSDGSVVSFTYTKTGQRASMVDRRGTTIYAYDKRDRVLGVDYPNGSRLAYSWDLGGNKTALTANVAGEVLTTTYSYDDLGRLATVTDSNGRVYQHGYDANGNRAMLRYPNGVTTSYAYDPLNRLTDIESRHSVHGTVASYSFTLGAVGNRIETKEADGTVLSYSYDSLYRLTTETVADGAGDEIYERVFTYDSVGNRLGEVTTGLGAGNRSYSYDDRDRLVAEGGQAYAWDTNGNLVDKAGEATYAWTLDDHLQVVTLEDGTEVRHTYDVDGIRVRTEVTPPGGSTRVVDHLVDISSTLSQVIAETDGGGNILAHYVRGDDLLATLRPIGITRYVHADGLGSVRTLTDDDGTITDQYDYTAFGELLKHDGADENTYLFSGQQLDANSGFYYHRARWMDPRVGRFASADLFSGLVSEPLSLHKYLYANVNPVNVTDPTGLFSSFDISAAMSALSNIATRVVFVGAQALTRARMAALSISTAVSLAIPFFVRYGPTALYWLRGSGMRGVNLLQRLYHRLPRPVTMSEAARAPNWPRHPGAILNQLFSGSRTMFSGIQWHHIVGQQRINLRRFGPSSIHSMLNLIPTPQSTHTVITSFYNRGYAWLPQGYSTFNQWIATQPWQEQYRIGLQIWREAILTGRVTFQL